MKPNFERARATKTMTAAALCMGLGAAACSPAVSLNMNNPLHSGGKVEDNTIEFPSSQLEGQFDLPAGTLTHRASLVSLTKKEVCFDVTLKTLAERKDLATPKGWRVFLRGEPEFEDKSVQIRDVQEPETQTVGGTVMQHDKANERICNDRGDCWNKEITTSYRVPKDFTVHTGQSTVCFANKGHIKNSTEEITLHFDDPNPDFGNAEGGVNFFAALTNRVAFRWKFN